MNFHAAGEYILKRLEKELPPNLYYHGIKHTLEVLRCSEEIAEAEGRNANDITLIKTAALYHDSGFMVRYRDNERLGCEIAATALPSFDYTAAEIKSIENMIMSTALPQSPKDKLSEILCDADLDYLGTEAFYPVSAEFRKELKEYGTEFTEKDWLKLELDFMQSHKYFTHTSQQKRNAMKNKHIQELKASYEKFD